MKINAIEIQDIRSFLKVPKTKFSDNINIFIGANNSGKSTILNCLLYLQSNVLSLTDISIGRPVGIIELEYTAANVPGIRDSAYGDTSIKIIFSKGNSNINIIYKDAANASLGEFTRSQEREPNHIFCPFLSKRKVVAYSDSIIKDATESVSGNLQYLNAKIDRISDPNFQPANSKYVKYCEEVLGFRISASSTDQGKEAAYTIMNSEKIPIKSMGEGVANILGLIADICVSENKIFLIEELENDIHPKSLKALLNIIIENSSKNQFFITTHSNIVMKYLGGVDEAKIFKVSNDDKDKVKPKMFISKLTEVSDDAQERLEVLEDLGYEHFDFDLWKGWLFLEESSAETIIGKYLIPWFAEGLKNKLRTYSAKGVTNIKLKFDDFNKLFVFLHLQPSYKNKVWVLIDGGENESKIITELKEVYKKSGWEESQFMQLKHHEFEKYYPQIFEKDVNRIFSLGDKDAQRKEKAKLLKLVTKWIIEDESGAKQSFATSAIEVIEILKEIESKLN